VTLEEKTLRNGIASRRWLQELQLHGLGRVGSPQADNRRRVPGRTTEGTVTAQVEQGGDTPVAVALGAVGLDDRADFGGQVEDLASAGRQRLLHQRPELAGWQVLPRHDALLDAR